MTRRLLPASLALLGGLAGPSAVAAAPSAPASNARLAGSFAMSGRVTVASDVPGERPGRAFHRSWAFSSQCGAAQCPTVTLRRDRAGGTDTLTLGRRSAAYYVGSGSFYAPVRCGSRIYPRGALVPFTIAVRITAATPFGSLALATDIRATYVNHARRNLTPCVAALGHDAARYLGALVGPA